MALPPAPAPLTVRQRLNALNPVQRTAFQQYLAGRQQQAVAPTPAPAAPGAPTTFVLPGSAEAEFGAQQANIGETYNQETAMNNYQLRNAQIQAQRQLGVGGVGGDIREGIQQARTALPDQYIQRGLFQHGSGIYGEGLSRFNVLAQRDLSRAQEDYTRQLAGLRLNRSGIERRRALALANLRMKHQAVLSDAAARSIK